MRQSSASLPIQAATLRHMLSTGSAMVLALCATGIASRAVAQTCPTPAVANNTGCTVPPGTTVTATPAGAVDLNASGTLGRITADGVTLNLAGATTVGAFVQTGATIGFNGSTLKTTAITTATSNGQTGLWASGVNSTVNASGSSITMGPPNGTTVANNLTGATADNGGKLFLINTPIQILGGATGVNNNGLIATGANSQISYLGGLISTLSRGSFGVLAQSGGTVTLGNAAQVSTTGGATVGTLIGSHALYATGTSSIINATNIGVTTSGAIANGVRAEAGGTVNLTSIQVTTTGAGSATGGTPSLGSHGLYALGAGSQIMGDTVTVNAAGNFTSAARAEAGGVITLTGSGLTTSGTSALDTDPTSAARAMSGGSLQISGSTLTGTGQRGMGFSVQDAGSTATVSDSTVSAAGTRANAAFIFNGGKATVSNSTLTSTGFSAVVVQDAGSSIDLTNTTIQANTPATVIGFGLRASSGASAAMTGGSVFTAGRDSPGIHAGNATITATNVAVTTTGNDNAMGVLSDGNSLITLNGGSVTTTGNAIRQASFPHALGARNPGGILVANGTIINTTGFTAMGAVADDGGTVILNGNRITTQGGRSIGLYSITEQVGAQFLANLTGTGLTVETFGAFAHGAAAQARNDVSVPTATLTVNDTSITTHGAGAVGLRATLADYGTVPVSGRGESVVIANNTTVFTEGIAALGVLSRDNPTSVTMNNTTVRTTGADAHGAVSQAGGLVVGNNTGVTATGAQASALFVVGDGGPVSNARFSNNSTLTNVSGPTIGVAGAGNITLANTTVGGSGQWLKVGTVGDFVPLAQVEPPLTGIPDIDTDPSDPPTNPAAAPIGAAVFAAQTAGLANIDVSASLLTGSALTLPGSVSNVTLRNGTVWNMTGSSNLTNLTNDSSQILYSAPAGDTTQLSSYKTLTVVNYVGAGGILGLNTFLGSDGAPSDRLIINGGNASGNSSLRIANTTGPGALTMNDGILVVEAVNSGTTNPGAFKLGNIVAAGPYEYLLFRGGVTPGHENDWFLRNVIQPEPPSPEPPSPGPTPPEPIPLFRPEAVLYTKVPLVARQMALFTLGTFHERQGDQILLQESGLMSGVSVSLSDGSGAGGSFQRGSAAWARAFGQTLDQRWSGVLSPEFKGDMIAVQLGLDLVKFESFTGHSDNIGLFYAHARTNGDGRGFVIGQQLVAGALQMTTENIGAYWTHIGPSGWYLDAVLMGTFFDGDPRSTRGIGASFKGDGIMASIEGAIPFRITSNLKLETQGQLIYQHTRFDPTADPFTTLSFNLEDNFTGRFGLRLEGDTSFNGVRLQPFAIANLWHAFQGTDSTVFNDTVTFATPFEATAFEIGGGIVAKFAESLGVYARGTYTTNVGGNYREAIKGQMGLRATW